VISSATVFAVAHRLGHRVRLARQAAGVDHQQLGKLVGVSAGIIVRVEVGDARVPLRVSLSAAAHADALPGVRAGLERG
jgi:ribosome-binding protein aMBF1 (putative translation factor)